MAELKISLLHALLTTWFLLFFQIQSGTAAATVPVAKSIRCVPRERDALLAFKAGLTDPDNYLSSWQGEDCCQWKGIRCSNHTGHVTELQLQSLHGFRGGQMSPSLLGLKNLRTLDLRGNNFSGAPIPDFIGGLNNLRYLYLSDANFGGRVLPQLGNLSKLLYLDLSRTNWDSSNIYSTDLSWLSRLTKLQYLDLSLVNLSTVIDWAHVVNKLPSLVTLNLRSCGLQNVIPSPVNYVNLTSLEQLTLSGNEFSSSLGPNNLFWDLPNLLHLEMEVCGLQGSIPERVGNMASLRILYLDVNNLTGTIPTTFKNLHNLEVLWLSENKIDGPVAVLLERLLSRNRLSELLLFENELTGSLPYQLGHLRNLTILQLDNNLLSGELPTSISALSKLTELSLCCNNLHGTITEIHFAEMASLETLDLSGNSLSMVFRHGWVPPFKLSEADLQSCTLGPRFPEWLRSQSSIYILGMSNVSIAGPIPHWFWVTFSRAQSLVLSKNKISGMLPPTMFSKMQAETIDFSDNCLVGSIPKLPKKLESLDLSRNNLSGQFPSDLGAPLIKGLMLFKNSISGRIPHYFCHLENLVFVDLSENQLHGVFPNCEQHEKAESSPTKKNNSSRIIMLNLNTNYLSGEFPTFLRKCQELIFLDLSYNQFSGILPTWIGDELPSLSFLSLRSNSFSGHIPQQLAKMTRLQYLDLASNNISGTIPQWLANLVTMAVAPQDDDSLSDIIDYDASFGDTDVITYTDSSLVTMKGQQLVFTEGILYMVNFDLSCNILTGHIPEEIGKLTAPKNFNLSWNHLSGVIPGSVGELHSLESLDLSHNELSGEIPASISALTWLSHLNLSYNSLTGKIPSGSQLQTLNDQASIYIGNPGLCGPPLSNNCSETSLTPATPEDHRDVSDTMTFLLAMGSGYLVGLWVVFCLFLFKKDWRVVCFSSYDRLYDWVYVKVALTSASLRRKQG